MTKNNWFNQKPKSTKRLTNPRKLVPTTYKKSPQSKETKSVLFCPRTEGGAFAQQLRIKESELRKLLKTKVRIIEETGQALADLLTT